MIALYNKENKEKSAREYIDKASTLLDNKNYSEAMKLFEIALEECKAFDPLLRSHPYSAMALIGVGGIQYANNDIASSIQNFLQALEIRTTLYAITDPYRPDTASLLSHIGNAYSSAQYYNEAVKYYNDSYIMYTHLYDEKNDNVVLSSLAVGVSLFKSNRYDESKTYLSQALKSLKETHPQDEATAKALIAIGGINYIDKNYSAALEFYQEQPNHFVVLINKEVYAILNMVCLRCKSR